MTKQLINIGARANDNSGDPLRTAFEKINSNFDELYAVSGISDLSELAQDYAAEMLVNGTHSGVNVEYIDSANKLNITVTIDGGSASTVY